MSVMADQQVAASEIAQLLEFAVQIAEAAAPIALRYFRASLDVQNKLSGSGPSAGLRAGFDPVTQADREVETFLRREIQRRFPEHGMIGEEHGEVCGASPFCWVIDPIDGTRAFISGSVAWGTLIGVTHDGVPIAGVAHIPYLRETFYGSGDGAWMKRATDRRKRQPRQPEQLSDAILYCTHPAAFATETDRREGRRMRAIED